LEVAASNMGGNCRFYTYNGKRRLFAMKKEIINGIITVVFMCVITLLSILVVSMCTFWWKWQADMAMKGITATYIISGLAGGLMEGCLLRRGRIKRTGILKALFYGIILSSAYWGIPGGIAMLLVKEHILDMGNFAMVFGITAGSITAGILFCQGSRRKIKT
jgi:hypothetical protein